MQIAHSLRSLLITLLYDKLTVQPTAVDTMYCMHYQWYYTVLYVQGTTKSKDFTLSSPWYVHCRTVFIEVHSNSARNE